MARPGRRRALAALTTAALAPALVPALGAPPAAAATRVEIVADGLDNPRGLAFGPDGALYVAEAGSSGDSPCVTALGGSACLGETGAVSRIDLDTQTHERVADGLPNLFLEGEVEGTGEAVGPSDVAFTEHGHLLLTIGLGADPAVRRELGDAGDLLGTLVAVDTEDGRVERVADIAAHEAAENPDEGLPDSNPNALLVREGEVLVADAGGNSVVAVDDDGDVETVAVLPARPVTVPGLPPDFPMQAVPTSLAAGDAGQVLVGQLTGFPFPQGAASVWSLDPEAARPAQPREFFGGFTNIIDVRQRDDDTFVLEIATNSLLSGPAAVGALARLRPDGSVQRIGEDLLRFPGGMTLGPDGALYISNRGTSAGTGQVIRIDPSEPSVDPAIGAACPPDDMAFPPFTDIHGTLHEEAIACLWWWDVVAGTSSGTFSPAGTLSRAQAAGLLARAAAASGVTLPGDAPDAFTDDEGSVHEDAINGLAALGLVRGVGGGRFAPAATVSRAQLASLAVRAGEAVLGEALPPGDDAFTDDEGSVHEPAIDKAAAIGWVSGVGGGRFAPGSPVSRAQAATVLARWLATMVEEGEATLPDPVSPD